MSKKKITSWINGEVQEIEVDDIVTVENEISVEDRLGKLEDKPVIASGNFLVGNGTKDYVEMTPSEALRHIDGASIATLTTAEYNALVEAEQTNANVLYMLTDAKEETIEVDEDSFKFKEDLTITYPLGKYQTLTNGVATIDAKNKTFKEVWNDIFCDDADGIVSPSISLSISGSTSAEVGETVSPVATLYEYAGSYTYGSTNGTGTNTGVEFTSRKISCSTTGESTTNSTLSLGTITYKDSSQTYSCSANASHGASLYTPKSKLGVEKTPIASGSCSDTAFKTFTGYRPFFYGAVTVNPSKETLTSELIRETLTNGGNYNASKTFTIKAEDWIPDDDNVSNPNTYLKAFVLAIPTANSRQRIEKVDSTAGMTVDVTSSYGIDATDGTSKRMPNFTVSVADYRGTNTNGNTLYNPTSYDIYIWNPASIDSGTVHEFKLY